MKGKGLFRLLALAFMIAIAVVIYKYYSINTAETMVHISHEPILLNKGDKIHFFKEGFAISGSSTRFYRPNGTAMSSPIPEQADTIDQHIINMSTPNFMLINGKSVYRTSSIPFEKLYELEDSSGHGIKELGNYLIILIEDTLVENTTGVLVPKLYDLKQNAISDIKDIESLYYMDSAFDSESNCISILTLSLDSPFPSSKVFNYTNENGETALFSFISADKKSFFKILRIPYHIILVGSDEIICYNIDGTIQWSIENKKIKNCTILETNSGFMFYFPQPIDSNDGVFFNVLEINSDGTYNKLDFPENLYDLQPFENGFIGLRYGRNVLVLNRSGSIKQEYYVPEDIVSLYHSEYHRDYIYLVDRDNQLHIYSISKEDL